MDLPDFVIAGSYDWLNFVEDVLSNSDVGVIPYPPNILHFSYTVLSKLFDYMAAGKPIISTNLIEVGNIIKMFNCGLVAKNWKEFKLYLETLYYDRELAKRLGENGRRAA
jgi:glycosyltransferase involved in cell wall biosynthesis